MGTDWTPERDAELIAHFGLDDPDSLLPEDKIRIAVHDLRAAWLDAEAALTMARARADAAAEERDAARDALRSDERQLCDDLILARRERDEAKRALGEVEGAVAERMKARLDAMAAETGAALARAERAETEVYVARSVLGGTLDPMASERDLLCRTQERDAALARVAELEAVLAEPSEGEALRQATVAHIAFSLPGPPTAQWTRIVRAILADLRKRAGGSDAP